jgi:hypothetical protein
MTWEPSWNNRRHHRHADFDVDFDARSAASARNLASAFEEDLEEEEGGVGGARGRQAPELLGSPAQRVGRGGVRRRAPAVMVMPCHVFAVHCPALRVCLSCFPAVVQAVEEKDRGFQGR